MLTILLWVLHAPGHISNPHRPSYFRERRFISLPGDLPATSRIAHSLGGALAKLLGGKLLVERGPQQRLYAIQGFITIASMLNHEAGDREKVHLAIDRVGILKTENPLKDCLAGASFGEHRATVYTAFCHFFPSRPHKRIEEQGGEVGNVSSLVQSLLMSISSRML